MYRLVFFFLSLALCSGLYAQTTGRHYLQLNASVDLLGNITVVSVEEPKIKIDKADSLINYQEIRSLISKRKTPVTILNALSKDGWELVTTAYIARDGTSGPNSPFLVFYLARHFSY